MTAEHKRILFCRCSNSDVIPSEVRDEVLAALSASGRDVLTVPDLCGWAGTRDERLSELDGDEWVVVACYPRVVRWLFPAAGMAPAIPEPEVLNMRVLSSAEILDRLGVAPAGGPSGAAGSRPILDGPHGGRPSTEVSPPFVLSGPSTGGPGSVRAVEDGGRTESVCRSPVPDPEAWTPWFPVIDYDRCRQCRQCLNFCLFGVYDLSLEGRVEVRHPQNCKTNCPACARICPEVAVMFPKYGEAPINGADITDEAAEKDKVRVNIDEVLGGDLYAALARRRKKAGKRLLDRDKLRRAIEERRACSLGAEALLAGPPDPPV